MKERHINLKAWEVRAILEGRKTQTRRMVKPYEWFEGHRIHSCVGAVRKGEISRYEDLISSCDGGIQRRCPYGSPGDRLWVREAFEVVRETCSYEVEEYDYFPWDAEFYGPPQHALRAKCPRGGERARVLYRADEDEPIERWRPSKYMPRWASRITLEVTGVRVERLQDISAHDAIAEGVEISDLAKLHALALRKQGRNISAAVVEYGILWESINGPGSWDVNPWVWVVEFKRVQEGGVA